MPFTENAIMSGVDLFLTFYGLQIRGLLYTLSRKRVHLMYLFKSLSKILDTS